MKFVVDGRDSETQARTAILETFHGPVHTPAFMPVGTIGTVKTLSPADLSENGSQIILGNTYHLFLKPGVGVLRSAGGLHRFISWSGPILTDSGGFQVYSLSELRKINEEGVEFRSHWDGSRHFFSPESVVDIQRIIGSDIMMVLDECIPNPSDALSAKNAADLSFRWAERARKHFLSSEPVYGYQQYQFGIVQGGIYPDLRRENMNRLLDLAFDGYAIGGLAVGETLEIRNDIVEVCTEFLPADKPRYLMGVGSPTDILESIDRGIDMFDCVIPTRNARNGTIITRSGKLGIRNARYKDDLRPIEEQCNCYTCRHFSRAYLRHLFNVKEILGLRLATIHNIHSYHHLMAEARSAITEGRYADWKKGIVSAWENE